MSEVIQCSWSCYGARCRNVVIDGGTLCADHRAMKCASCGAPTTHGCGYCGQFVCGAPLCDSCEGYEDHTQPSGAWGFMNHRHRPKHSVDHAAAGERAGSKGAGV